MKILFVTTSYPNLKVLYSGTFVKQLEESIIQKGHEVEVLFFRGKGNPINYLKARKKLKELLAARSFDIIHVHSGQAALVTLGLKIPVIIRYLGSDLQGIVNRKGKYSSFGILLILLSRMVAWLSAANIVPAAFMKKYLPPANVFVIPAGVDFQRFYQIDRDEACRKLDIDPGKRYVLFAANPKIARKRFSLAQKAIHLLNKEFQQVQLLFPSNVSHSEMIYYFNAAELLLLTSLHEGSPNVVKEALACNLKVVSTDTGDVRERIGQLKGCKVVPVNIPSADLARVIKECLLSNEREDYRKIIEPELNLERIAKKHVEVYAYVLNKRKN